MRNMHGVLGERKLYSHGTEGLMQNDNVKILWDFNLQADHLIVHRRPDIVVTNKKDSICDIIDIAIPGEERVIQKD